MRYNSKQWDEIRGSFSTSIMVDTPLHSLAQNLEGPDWPIKDKKETPAGYIDLTFSEVQEVLAEKGQPMERFDQLVDILKETLAFDNPFGDMVEQAAESSERDNPLLKTMARLEIPENFPIEYTALQTSTLDFCRLEKITTLGQFAVFAQGLSQAVIVGGDFRALLNALSHVDEPALAKYLPFRVGHKGLHLVEALAQLARTIPADQRTLLLTKPTLVNPSIRENAARLATFFSTERSTIRTQLAAPGASLGRILVIINDPTIESLVAALLTPHVKSDAPAPVAVAKKSWFGRLFSKK
ncbi:MAG TPA: hypothetical protein PLN52_22235 [Opitutaceae bacterium]|nr:hypothetical protein [Opitutaceae bacterium]